MTEPIVWQYGAEGGYHDSSCRCPGHCGNCFEDLDRIRREQQQLIEQGKLRPEDKLGKRRRYCSGYCQGRAARERAFDRYLQSGGRR